MTREQHHATRELQRAQENWLRAYGWLTTINGRWSHQHLHASSLGGSCTMFDALQLTRGQPLLFGAVRTAAK